MSSVSFLRPKNIIISHFTYYYRASGLLVSTQTDLIVITGYCLLTPSSLQFFFTLRLDIGEELTEDTTFQIEF